MTLFESSTFGAAAGAAMRAAKALYARGITDASITPAVVAAIIFAEFKPLLDAAGGVEKAVEREVAFLDEWIKLRLKAEGVVTTCAPSASTQNIQQVVHGLRAALATFASSKGATK